MPFKRVCLLLALGSAVLSGPLLGQTPSSESDLERGIRLVEEGDYDSGILTLDTAARRLASEPARLRELSQAYLYLGIAFLGKGHEAAARAKFRDALAKVKDLSLSPEKFPPKVIDLFEAAREESARMAAAASTAPSQAAAAVSASPPRKKGHGKAILIGVGLAAAGGVGVAVAAGGGGSEPSGGSNSPSGGGEDRTLETFQGVLCGDFAVCEQNRQYNISVAAAGLLEATATWVESRAQFTLELQDSAGRRVAVSNRVDTNTAQLQASVSAQTYRLMIDRQDEQPGPFPFTLTVRHP